MPNVTQMLEQIQGGDRLAAERLLPVLYEELKILANQRMAHEKPGQTLQATALVHEAYLRLVDDADQSWDSRGHFFAAAAEAMRRILVETARRKQSLKRGGHLEKVQITIAEPAVDDQIDLIQLNDALDQLAARDPRKAELVKLRYFAGLTIEQAAEALGVSVGTANNDWVFAKTWLRREMA